MPSLSSIKGSAGWGFVFSGSLVSQAGIELLTLLPPLPECWDSRDVSALLVGSLKSHTISLLCH